MAPAPVNCPVGWLNGELLPTLGTVDGLSLPGLLQSTIKPTAPVTDSAIIKSAMGAFFRTCDAHPDPDWRRARILC
jgi:hypothetical protein